MQQGLAQLVAATALVLLAMVAGLEVMGLLGLIEAAVATGKIVNLKKGQFLSPPEMGRVVEKAKLAGGTKLLVTERGTIGLHQTQGLGGLGVQIHHAKHEHQAGFGQKTRVVIAGHRVPSHAVGNLYSRD